MSSSTWWAQSSSNARWTAAGATLIGAGLAVVSYFVWTSPDNPVSPVTSLNRVSVFAERMERVLDDRATLLDQVVHLRGELTAAEADLAAGNLVVIYPEGSVTRDPGWWPMEARTGVARLALTTDAVVLPVAQWGPQRIHDYQAKKLHLRLRQPTDYLVGEPVDLTALRAEVRAGRALTPELLRETTDLIMGRVRDQLAELRGEPAPVGFAPRPRKKLSGDLPGTAA